MKYVVQLLGLVMLGSLLAGCGRGERTAGPDSNHLEQVAQSLARREHHVGGGEMGATI